MSLKALAHNVLERNPSRNHGATRPNLGRNNGAKSVVKKQQKLRSNRDWETDIGMIIEWFADLPAPASSFQLHKGVSITDPVAFWQSIKREIAAGPGGPRITYGALQSDLRRLSALFGGPA
tara:strand:+ start:780 stop:1142 length:363 start_codon:yes stop_codon:yes gene_type:complete